MSPLVKIYKGASAQEKQAGEAWYRVAGEWCDRLATLFPYSSAQIACALAALSPGQTWSRNKRALVRLLVGAESPILIPGYGLNVDKARRILAGKGSPFDLMGRGLKINAFARNILGDYEPVAIDRWAARAAGVSPPQSEASYRKLEREYQAGAEHCGAPPAVFQATVWGIIRGSWK